MVKQSPCNRTEIFIYLMLPMKKQNPVTIVLFGATGDLAIKKLFPALVSLFNKGLLPSGSRIVAVSRRQWTNIEFKTFITQTVPMPTAFLEFLFYSEVEFETGRGYNELVYRIKELDATHGKTQWFVYLSLAPHFYKKVIDGIRQSKLLSNTTSKLLIEKPFGIDERSALILNKSLMYFLKHEQIYRVDHYLGKETVRAIAHIHEEGPWLSQLLSSKTVDSIRIALFESIGIEKRAVSYEGVGAFRDVAQNHLFAMLSVLAVTPPKTKGSIAWHHARAKVIRALVPPKKTCELSRRGQYVGYTQEADVHHTSQTETAFEVITAFTSGKLAGVPITIQAGKKMSRSHVFIEVLMKKESGLKKMFFNVQPEQKIFLEYFDRTEETVLPKKHDAYEYIFIDALAGKRAHFVGGAEVVASWKYTDKIVACWNVVPLEQYDNTKPFIAEKI